MEPLVINTRVCPCLVTRALTKETDNGEEFFPQYRVSLKSSLFTDLHWDTSYMMSFGQLLHDVSSSIQPPKSSVTFLCNEASLCCCCCLVARSCLTLCHPMDYSTPGFPVLSISQSLLKHVSIESVMPSNRLVLCCPLLLLFSIFLSIRVFSNELGLHIVWPKY